ncbi:YfiR/HmsC family protein [Sphingomonas qomolangmaensis]|uniref:YfiR family protein n=1 Tax=Sphingomonas qomolangmaensis TaxID=2918765 RepID=A0ABY5LAP2_9SPHN|nr:YfiR/HmsC family protein [Sphingomonas qomolangmaensis]UUL84039.1 YfiR family protein [Sphingomonas qomolangmaensis]
MTPARLPVALLFASTVACAVPTTAFAQMTDSSVLVAGRVATFLQPTLSGEVIAAIIYLPGAAASESQARAIERALRGGLVVGALTLRPRRVPSTSLAGLAGARVAFVTTGVNYQAVARATASRSILTISSDAGCTQAGHCVVTIISKPKVRIVVSKAASRAAQLRFNSGFLMLVKEI